MELSAIQGRLQAMLEPEGRGAIAKGIDMLRHADEVRCARGLHMSVQASRNHYCSPRNNDGPWTHVEVGFPSRRVAALLPYIDGSHSSPTANVYGYVPIEIVAEVVADYGGFAEERTPEDCLRQAARRDAEKGGDGWRDTAEVAEWTRLHTGRARVLLERLHERSLIEAAQDGRKTLWRALARA